MKKKILYLLLVVLLLSGCGKVPKLENGQEAVVSFENGEMISVDDLYKEIKNNYGLATLVTMLDKYVLETSFKDYIETSEEYAENYIKALKENYDTDEAFLTDIQNYTGFSTIEAYKEYIYVSYMQSHAVEEYAKTLITDKEIESYYETDVVGDIEVSHILITPEVTDEMTDEEQKAAEEAAKKTAEDIIAKLKKADNLKDTFTELAKEHSKDDATKDKGGSLGKINKSTLGSEYDELVDAAYSIKDNTYYAKVVTTELGYHVVMRTASYDKASLEDSKESIIKELATAKISNDKTMNVTALQHYRKELGMEIQDTDLQTQFAYYVQNQLNSVTEEESK